MNINKTKENEPVRSDPRIIIRSGYRSLYANDCVKKMNVDVSLKRVAQKYILANVILIYN